MQNVADWVGMHRLRHVVIADDDQHKSQAAIPEQNWCVLNAAQRLKSKSYLSFADFYCVSYATFVPEMPRSAMGGHK